MPVFLTIVAAAVRDSDERHTRHGPLLARFLLSSTGLMTGLLAAQVTLRGIARASMT